MRIGTIACAVIVAVELLRGIAAAAPQPVATDRIEGVTVQVLVEGGKLLLGPNDIVVELRPSAGPPDVKDVVLIAERPDAPAESFNIDLSSDGGGRFHGTVTLPWLGHCRLEVAWHDEHGHHSRAFTVPVVVGHH
jgi:hypothetical protein